MSHLYFERQRETQRKYVKERRGIKEIRALKRREGIKRILLDVVKCIIKLLYNI